MDRAHVDECLMNVGEQLSPFDPAVILEMLMAEYMLRHSTWPKETKDIMILVLASLTKHVAGSQDSVIAASAVLNAAKVTP